MDNHPQHVDREYVLRVLRAHHVECVPVPKGQIETYTIKKGEVIDAQPFTAKVRRRILMRLSIKFDIPCEFFFPSSAKDLPTNT